jgi:diguanylate cyclase (GGDEF)-like protein
MNGAELCRALREHEGVRFAYVLVVTAHSDAERLVETFDSGADDFLAKPINRQELLARLRAGERVARLEEDVARRTREIHRLNAESAVANQKLEEANKKLTTMATTDELTGIMNRREAMARLKELWAYHERYGPEFACIMVDIDHFKKFNDTHGHAVGDMVLRATAAILRTTIRKTDFVARVGGEEFLVLCPHVGVDGGAVCAEHMRSAVEKYVFTHESAQLNVTISLGVAQRDESMGSPDELMRKADTALYEAKAQGRNRVAVATCPKVVGPLVCGLG